MPRLLAHLGIATLLIAAAACGDDDSGGPAGDSDDETSPSGGSERLGSADSGLIVGVRVGDGGLLDALAVVDPESADTVEVEVDEPRRGVPAGPGRALFDTDAGVVLVDATAEEITELGLSEIDFSYSQSAVVGRSDRVTVLLSPFGDAAFLVDLESGSVTDLMAVADGPGLVTGAEVAPDGAMVLLNTDAGPFLFPTDAPTDARSLDGDRGRLIDAGTAVLLTGDDGVLVSPIDGGDETVVSSEPALDALAIDARVLLVHSDEVVLVEPGSEDSLVSAPFEPGGSAPRAVAETVLVPADDESTWTLVDGDAATASTLDGLEGLSPQYSGQPSRWVPFSERLAGGEVLVAVDTQDESVQMIDLPDGSSMVGPTTVAGGGSRALVFSADEEGASTYLVDLATGAVEDLGADVQGASFSPDGSRLAWSTADDGLRVAPVDDVGAASVVAEGVALPVWLAAG